MGQMSITNAPEELWIKVEGRFDFSNHQEFKLAYESCMPPPKRYCIDLKEATYLDSSALGMLLLLRDYAGGENAEVKLLNPRPAVREILMTSCFDTLFVIE